MPGPIRCITRAKMLVVRQFGIEHQKIDIAAGTPRLYFGRAEPTLGARSNGVKFRIDHNRRDVAIRARFSLPPFLTGPEKDILKKYESRFLTLDVKPEYDIDKINNGLYR